MREAVGATAPAGRPGRGRRPGARESILDAIRASEPLSRVELARMTGLTEAAVSMTVRRLLEEGLVVETGRTPTGGKPRTCCASTRPPGWRSACTWTRTPRRTC